MVYYCFLERDPQPLQFIVMKAFNFTFKKESLSAGLDIGSSSLKLALLQRKNKDITLKKISLREFSPSDDLASVISDFMASQGLSNAVVNVSLSGQPVITRYLSWPRMSLGQLKEAMQFEARQYIPLPLEEVNLDCAILNEKIEEDKMLVALAAVKKTVVQERMSLLEKCGIRPKIIDADCFCLVNAFNHSQGRQTNVRINSAILDIGLRYTNMAVLEGSDLKFSRDILAGSRESELNSLVSEINSSIDYYENQNGRQIEKIFLSGGAVYSQAVMDFLKHQLNLPFEAFSVFSGLNIDPSLEQNSLLSKPSLFAVALGLALR